MGVQFMNGQQIRQVLMSAVREEFNKVYPFLRIDYVKKGEGLLSGREMILPEDVRSAAKDLLKKDIHLSDAMLVHELETSLYNLFGTPAQISRKSGKSWMETRMTRNWTLKQQNDHGQDLETGYR